MLEDKSVKIGAEKRGEPEAEPETVTSDCYVKVRLPGEPEVVEKSIEDQQPSALLTGEVESKPAAKKVALLVVHGMGSQVPFETVQAFTDEIRNQHYRNTKQRPFVTVVLADLNGTVLPRAEIKLQRRNDAYVDLHVYEAYWAPLTEGKVTAREAMWFLFMAGLRGITRSGVKGKFERWMFGGWQGFKIRHIFLLIAFLAAVLVLVSLFVMNAAIATLTAKSIAAPSGLLSVVAGDIWTFEWLAALYLSIGIGIPMLIRSGRTKAGDTFELSNTWKRFLRFWVFLTIALTIWSGAGVSVELLTKGRCSLPSIGGLLMRGLGFSGKGLSASMPSGTNHWIDGAFAFLSKPLRCHDGGPAVITGGPTPGQIAVLGIAVVIAYVGRWFLREFVGDVAVYISSYTVSKFDALRDQIQKTALDVFLPVFQQRKAILARGTGTETKDGMKQPEDEFEYEEIVVAGHSLGSLIAYDTIDALINLPREKLQGGKPLNVPGRTKAFITFGSPMDKTAFIFRTQRPVQNEVREALAGAKQPMILDYKFRPKRWVNIFAIDDWISGALEYYDPPETHDKHGKKRDSEDLTREELCRLKCIKVQARDLGKVVENIPDPEACIPLASHVFYFTSRLLHKELLKAILS